jgi:DNA-binding transcriptional LysR family regulator
VVEHRGVTKAARPLELSQSTVSETVSTLERTLGVSLFRKSSEGLLLTPAGEVLLGYAKRMLTLASELMGDLAKASTHVSATLVVSTVESVSAYVLPSRLAALRARWPGVRLEVITGACHSVRENVAAGKSDLGLVLEAGTTPDADSILARGRLAIVGAPKHPLAGRPVTPDELRRCDFFMCDTGGNYTQVLRAYFDAAQLPMPRTQSLGTVEGVKRGILAGGPGVGLVPAHAVERELHEGLLVDLDVRPALPPLLLCAVLAPTQPCSPMVDDLLQRLRGAASLST